MYYSDSHLLLSMYENAFLLIAASQVEYEVYEG